VGASQWLGLGALAGCGLRDKQGVRTSPTIYFSINFRTGVGVAAGRKDIRNVVTEPRNSSHKKEQ